MKLRQLRSLPRLQRLDRLTERHAEVVAAAPRLKQALCSLFFDTRSEEPCGSEFHEFGRFDLTVGDGRHEAIDLLRIRVDPGPEALVANLIAYFARDVQSGDPLADLSWTRSDFLQLLWIGVLKTDVLEHDLILVLSNGAVLRHGILDTGLPEISVNVDPLAFFEHRDVLSS
jgi:hypothetical protein